jgi:hypothetical protein
MIIKTKTILSVLKNLEFIHIKFVRSYFLKKIGEKSENSNY